MKLFEISQILHGRLIGDDKETSFFCSDSRKCQSGSLFFALKGKKTDGHNFVCEVYKNGGFAVVNHVIKGSSHIVVKDVRASLMNLSTWKLRKTFKIAITGSNGKTTTKNMIASLLENHGRVCKTIENFNTDVGISLSVLNGPKNPKYCVMEIGASSPGDVESVSKIFKPDLSVITSIGSSHSAFMDVVREKSSISKDTKGVVIYDGDERIKEKIKSKGKIFENHIREVEYKNLNTLVKIGDEEVELNGIWGIGQIKDLELALNVMNELKLKWTSKDLKKLSFSKGRMRFERIGDYTIVDDTYNANLESLENVAKAAFDLKGRNVIWVLSPMKEIKIDCLSEKLMNIFKRFRPKDVFTIGEFFYPFGRSYAIKKIMKTLKPNDIVIVKGSRVCKMEKVVEEIKEALND